MQHTLLQNMRLSYGLVYDTAQRASSLIGWGDGKSFTIKDLVDDINRFDNYTVNEQQVHRALSALVEMNCLILANGTTLDDAKVAPVDQTVPCFEQFATWRKAKRHEELMRG